MKIKTKIILGFTIVSLLMVAAGTLSIYFTQNELEKSIGAYLLGLASKTSDDIDRNVYYKIEYIESFIKTSPDLILALKDSNQRFDSMSLKESYIAEMDKEWVSAPKTEITGFMRDLIDSPLSGNLRELINFYEKKYKYQVLGEIFVTNKYGVNIAQSGKTTDYNQADEEWWQIAKKNGLYVRDVELDESSGIYSTDFALRINDENGVFLGAVKVTLNIDEAIGIINETEAKLKYRGARFHILDHKGRFIYGLGHKFFESYPYLSRIQGASGYFMEPGYGKATRPAFIAYVHSDGFRNFKGLNWIILLNNDKNEVLLPIVKIKGFILYYLLISAGAAIFIGTIILLSLKSLGLLQKAVADVSLSNFNIDVSGVKTKDEIGDLARAFEAMADNLQKTTVSCDKLVVEIDERKRLEERLVRLNDCFLHFGSEPSENIKRLTEVCGEIMQADYALYNRLQGEFLYSLGQWHTPPDYNPLDKPQGHICYEVINKGSDEVFIVRNLPQTAYAQTDSNVSRYQLMTYIGKAIRCCGNYVGSLCVLYQKDFIPSEEDKNFIRVVASAIGIEEERLFTQNSLNDAYIKLKATEVHLVQSEKMASLGRLVAGIAHELNNPMGYVLSNISTLDKYVSALLQIMQAYHRYALLLKEGRLSDVEAAIQELDRLKEQEDFSFLLKDMPNLISETKEGINKIKGIIQDLRVFSHAEKVDKTYADINACIESTLRMLWNEIKYKADVVKEFAPLPQIPCYPQDLTQAFTNIIVNAVDAIAQHGTITIRTSEKQDNVIIEISDTGAGMSDEVLSRIFEPFYTTKDPGKGTGLGLSITHEIIRKHEGEIRVFSKLGQGSTFIISIPIKGRS